MIRWRFVITRLLILLALMMLARWGMGPLVRYASIKTLEASVGSKADIAQARIGLFPPRIQYIDVQVGDPRKGKERVNAFTADTIDLMIDGDELMQRRLVVRDGRITGLRIGSQRDSSGHLPAKPVAPAKGPSVFGQLMKSLGASAGNKAESIAEDLETVKRSREIRARWESEYADLTRRAKWMETEIRQIRDEAKGIDNPLRDLPRLKSTIQRAEAVAQESLAIRRKMDELPARIPTDWASLEEAKRIDLQRVNAYLPSQVEGLNDLGPELVRGMVRQQIDRVQGYLESGRQIAAWTVTAPETERHRGEVIPLHRSPLPPGILIRRSELSGLMSVDGDTFAMTGILENVTPHTDRLQKPLRARLRLEGPRVARVEFKRFYNEQIEGQPVRDQVTVHWPGLRLPRTSLGNPEDGCLEIDGGKLELYVQVDAVGDRLSGRLISKQTDSAFTLQVPSKAEKLAMTRALRKSLAEIDRVDIQAEFSGTWRKLDLAMSTSLSDALAQSLQDAVDSQLAESKALLANRVDAAYREQIQTLQAWLNGQHTKASELVAEANQEIASVREKLVAELPQVGAYTGRIGSLLQGLK